MIQLALGLWLVVLALPGGASGEPVYGRGAYFFSHERYRVAALRASISEAPEYALAVLWGTPGRARLPELGEQMADPRLALIEFHLINECCVRNWNCGPYEPLRGYTVRSLKQAVRRHDRRALRRIRVATARASAWILPRLRPNTALLISPFLETWFNSREFRIAARPAQRHFGSRAVLVWSPGFKVTAARRPPAPAEAIEYHGLAPVFPSGVPCVANTDGDLMPPVGWGRYFRAYPDCLAVFGWVRADNCITEDYFMPPRQRRCSTEGFAAVGRAMTRAARRSGAASGRSTTIPGALLVDRMPALGSR